MLHMVGTCQGMLVMHGQLCCSASPVPMAGGSAKHSGASAASGCSAVAVDWNGEAYVDLGDVDLGKAGCIDANV